MYIGYCLPKVHVCRLGWEIPDENVLLLIHIMLVCKCSTGTNDPGSLLPSKLLGMPAESTACSLDACASPIISEKAKKKEKKKNRIEKEWKEGLWFMPVQFKGKKILKMSCLK